MTALQWQCGGQRDDGSKHPLTHNPPHRCLFEFLFPIVCSIHDAKRGVSLTNLSGGTARIAVEGDLMRGMRCSPCHALLS